MAYVTRRQKREKRRKKLKIIGCLLVAILIALAVVYVYFHFNHKDDTAEESQVAVADDIAIPEFSGEPWAEVNDGKPLFDTAEITTEVFENYSKLDSLGRCQVAYANICPELMPTEERGEIGNIKPTGWQQAKYEGVVDSKPPYLYNRCHLIAFCLAGENDNEKNLITGTRYMNVNGMLSWEEKVARYVDKTGNHVLYRVTPDFRDKELVARGVLIEAYSVEDHGEGICFCVYCYNVQPGVVIDYSTGESKLE